MKKNPTELFPFPPFPSFSRGVGFYSNSRYKIVALKKCMNHPDKSGIDFSFLTTLLQNTTETIFCSVTFDPFSDFHNPLLGRQWHTFVP